jgi:glycosyltransferase involved in cell wall biosynthesis
VRLTFVVQRYGPEVNGGAELQARGLAELLAPRHEVEVLTTCARDYLTWADYYQPGVELINGVRVLRFRVDEPRDMKEFNAFSERIFGGEHSAEEELEWLRLQGPYSSALLAAIEGRRQHVDLFIFVTYLYATTFFGLPLAGDKALLLPEAHDEPPIYLEQMREVFRLPRFLLYNTEPELAFLRRRFPDLPLRGAEIGFGVDLPPLAEQEDDPPALLFMGRIHPAKGCGELFDYFTRYKRERPGPLRLVLAGTVDMTLPPHPDVVYAGFVQGEPKQQLIAGSTLVVMPSPYESLSIICLEAWAAGKPTLTNGASEVLREQSLRSGGGLYFKSYGEFAACLDLLLGDRALRCRLGLQGRRFVAQRYTWPAVEQRLEAALQGVGRSA